MDDFATDTAETIQMVKHRDGQTHACLFGDMITKCPWHQIKPVYAWAYILW